MLDKGSNINFYGGNFYFIFDGDYMATLTELIDTMNGISDNIDSLNSKADEVITSVGLVDLKLDDIRALIATLKAGAILTQEDLDSLVVKATAIKDASAGVVAKADQLKTSASAIVTEANEAV